MMYVSQNHDFYFSNFIHCYLFWLCLSLAFFITWCQNYGYRIALTREWKNFKNKLGEVKLDFRR